MTLEPGEGEVKVKVGSRVVWRRPLYGSDAVKTMVGDDGGRFLILVRRTQAQGVEEIPDCGPDAAVIEVRRHL